MSLAALYLSRIAYGFHSQEIEKFNSMGWEAYLEEQLNPDENTDTVLNQKIREAKLKIEYEERFKGKMMKVNEERLLSYLDAPLEKLWALQKEQMPYQEKIRPADEVRAATWLRALYSRWQLKELLVEFWHNHFSVNTYVEEKIATLFPLYDRDVIRKHCLGNFRELLEAVACHPVMLYYLDNFNSKASPANENYARELFELHTLGAGNYLNHLYNRWREVPGATEGKAQGYIDEDIYEAARAFTGWTVADGSEDEKGGRFPNTGGFHYYEGWHDNYQKRILGVEFSPNQPPLADGRKVLDLVAYHPATARFICTKLCCRFIADDPPTSIIEKAIVTWTDYQKSPQQIKETIKTILLSEECKDSLGKKMKRPFELLVSFLKGVGAELKPSILLHYFLLQMGYYQFAWPTPTGHPDTEKHWLNSNMLLMRWKLIPVLLWDDWHHSADIDLVGQMPAKVKTCEEIVDFWISRLAGKPLTDNTKMRLINLLAAGGIENEEPLGSKDEVFLRLKAMVVLIGTCPEFQYR